MTYSLYFQFSCRLYRYKMQKSSRDCPRTSRETNTYTQSHPFYWISTISVFCVCLFRSCTTMTTTTMRSVSTAPAAIAHLPTNLLPARTKLYYVMTATATSFPPNVWPATRPSCQVCNATAGLVTGSGRYHYRVKILGVF